jgi:chromosomal replication initiation ATPase DnaA
MNYATLEQIEEFSCTAYQTTMEEVKQLDKTADPSAARWLIFYLLFRFTGMTSQDIGIHYGIDYSNVNNAYKGLKKRYDKKGSLYDTVRDFELKYITT